MRKVIFDLPNHFQMVQSLGEVPAALLLCSLASSSVHFVVSRQVIVFVSGLDVTISDFVFHTKSFCHNGRV